MYEGTIASVREWTYGQCVVLWIERSGFEPWPGHCVVFFGKIL